VVIPGPDILPDSDTQEKAASDTADDEKPQSEIETDEYEAQDVESTNIRPNRK
jgi:hypothetical protein